MVLPRTHMFLTASSLLSRMVVSFLAEPQSQESIVSSIAHVASPHDITTLLFLPSQLMLTTWLWRFLSCSRSMAWTVAVWTSQSFGTEWLRTSITRCSSSNLETPVWLSLVVKLSLLFWIKVRLTVVHPCSRYALYYPPHCWDISLTLPSPLLNMWDISLTLPSPLLDIFPLLYSIPVHPSLSFTHAMELDYRLEGDS